MKELFKSLLVILLLTALLISCISEEEREIKRLKNEGVEIFVFGLEKIRGNKLWHFLNDKYEAAGYPFANKSKVSKDSIILAIKFALEIDEFANSNENLGNFIEDESMKGIVFENIKSKQEISIEIREFVKRQFPNNSKLGEDSYNRHIESYKFMTTVKDKEILDLSESKKEYPGDYTGQMLFYNEQLNAKYYMNGINIDDEIKSIVKNKYPNYYDVQRYLYYFQKKAKIYMTSVTNEAIKAQAVLKYPNDYVLQKDFYDGIAY